MNESQSNKGHETRDIGVKAVSLSGVAVLVSIPLIMLIVAGLLRFDWSVHSSERRIFTDDAPQIPGPRLQAHPEQDWAKYKSASQYTLNHWTRSELDTSQIHMPIEQAMQQVVDDYQAKLNSQQTEGK